MAKTSAVLTTQFTGHKTDIPGLIVFDVTDINDERGYFQEKFQYAKLVQAGLPESFKVVQTNLSYNKEKGVTRGIHAEPWDKYISIVKGRVFAAYVDLRKGPTFGKVVTVELDKNKTVFLPRGVGNSYQTLEPDTYYLYSVTAHWSADNYDKYCFLNLADPDTGIAWPIPLSKTIMSERDKTHATLKDIKPLEP